VKVALWAMSSGYRDGQLVGIDECGCMGCNEGLCRGSWLALVNEAVLAVSSRYGKGQMVGTVECGFMGCNEGLW
jgi:hypothetical protein